MIPRWNSYPKDNKAVPVMRERFKKNIEKLNGRALVDATSVDIDNRTFDVVFATEEKVYRRSWEVDFYEVLVCDKDSIRSQRLDAGTVPVIDNHNSSSVTGQYGTVISWKIEKKRCVATIKFTTRPEAAGLWMDIVSGIVKNVSVGYRTWKMMAMPLAEGEKVPTYRVVDWEPLEISLCSIAADFNAVIRSEGENTNEMELVFPNTIEGVRDEMTFLNKEYFNNKSNIEMQNSNQKITDSNMVRALNDVLLDRLNPEIKDINRNDPLFRKFRNASLIDIAIQRLEAKGVDNASELSKHELVTRAVSTTDFPEILQASFGRILRDRYSNIVQNWKWMGKELAPKDFRTITGVKLDGDFTFEELAEGGEFKESKVVTDESANIALKTFGRKFSISRHAIINDDLMAITTLPDFIGEGAANFQRNKLLELLTNNTKASDGKAIFHVDHRNLATNTLVGPPSIETLDAARIAMRRQVNVAGNSLGIRPAYLIVPPELETIAEKLVTEITPTVTQEANVFSHLKLVVDHGLEDPKAWYLSAGEQALSQYGLVYAYLNGKSEPDITKWWNFNNDNLEFKARIDFNVAVWGWQAWYKNPGL